MTLEESIRRLCVEARDAARILATAGSAAKDAALIGAAVAIDAHADEILAANAADTEAARAKGLAPAMIDRLTLTPERLADISRAVREVASLPDPVGEVMESRIRPNGLVIEKRRTPIGVIGVIYEARPNVTAETAALCLKAGNAVVLRGGAEALRSNIALAKAFSSGVATAGLPGGSVRLLPFTDRASVPALCSQAGLVDLIIPRGGRGLVQTVVENARMPVIKHFLGICHVFVDAKADPDMAEKIIVNAKCSRPSACNAAETLLVDSATAPGVLPRLALALLAKGVELRADGRSLPFAPGAKVATEEDFDTEHLAPVLNVATVDGLDGALAHIARHGTGHSDAIITEDAATAAAFLDKVDSACVYHNASTRFTDGGEFGFGAEIGISTDKLHARGPMGLVELTSYKYRITGAGQVR